MKMVSVGLLGLLLLGAPVQAQSLRDVATAAARVDRNDRDAVMVIQMQLQELGFYQGDIDGIFGVQTFDAAVNAVETVDAEVAQQQQDRAERSRVMAASNQDFGGGSDAGSDRDMSVDVMVARSTPDTGRSGASYASGNNVKAAEAGSVSVSGLEGMDLPDYTNFQDPS